MQKYYFRLTDGLRTILDHSGREFDGVEQAREYANTNIGLFSRRCAQFNGGGPIQQSLPDSAGLPDYGSGWATSWLAWSVQVVDERGAQVFTMALPPLDVPSGG